MIEFKILENPYRVHLDFNSVYNYNNEINNVLIQTKDIGKFKTLVNKFKHIINIPYNKAFIKINDVVKLKFLIENNKYDDATYNEAFIETDNFNKLKFLIGNYNYDNQKYNEIFLNTYSIVKFLIEKTIANTTSLI